MASQRDSGLGRTRRRKHRSREDEVSPSPKSQSASAPRERESRRGAAPRHSEVLSEHEQPERPERRRRRKRVHQEASRSRSRHRSRAAANNVGSLSPARADSLSEESPRLKEPVLVKGRSSGKGKRRKRSASVSGSKIVDAKTSKQQRDDESDSESAPIDDGSQSPAGILSEDQQSRSPSADSRNRSQSPEEPKSAEEPRSPEEDPEDAPAPPVFLPKKKKKDGPRKITAAYLRAMDLKAFMTCEKFPMPTFTPEQLGIASANANAMANGERWTPGVVPFVPPPVPAGDPTEQATDQLLAALSQTRKEPKRSRGKFDMKPGDDMKPVQHSITFADVAASEARRDGAVDEAPKKKKRGLGMWDQ